KPFSFGCPSIESVSNRFLNKNRPINDNTNILIEAYRMVRTNKLVQHYNESLPTCAISLGARRLQTLLQCRLQHILAMATIAESSKTT
ncbi:hypothetical protein Golax_023333, partial [Gossypium laxum]|nr:hypothetical protein [Gossypium laxum]